MSNHFSPTCLMATIEIGGMTCGSCVATIESVVSTLPGVTFVSVNLATERGVVYFEPEEITAEQITTEIDEMEFPSKLLSVENPSSDVQKFERVKLFIPEMKGKKDIQILDESLQSFSSNIIELSIEPETCEVSFKYSPDTLGIRTILSKLSSKGFSPMFPEKQTLQTPISLESKKLKSLFIKSLFSSIPVMFICMIFPMIGVTIFEKDDAFSVRISWSNILGFILASYSQFFIGRKFYVGSYKALSHYEANMDVLVSLATSCAYLYSVIAVLHGMVNEKASVMTFFDTSSMLITFILLGKFLEARAKGQTVTAIQTLMSLQPPTAWLITKEGETYIEREISVDLLQKGDLLRVGAGDKVPTDGIITSGVSAIDESMLTGESLPVSKGVGSQVIGGTINTSGVFEMRVSKIGQSTGLAQIIKLVQDAQGKKAPIQRFADQAARVFVPIVVSISIVTFIVWLSLCGSGIVPEHDIPEDSNHFLFSLLFSISVVIIACPCALGLATPTAVMVGTGVAARNGILIKGGPPLEIAHRVNTVIFDKTGTLTQGTSEVTHWSVYSSKYKAEEFFQLVLSIEKGNPHPFSKAISDYVTNSMKMDQNSLQFLNMTSTEYISGRGIMSEYKGKKYYVGNKKMMQDHNLDMDAECYQDTNTWSERGHSIVYVANDESIFGMIAFEDQIKNTAPIVVRALESEGISVYMVTGDGQHSAIKVASKLGIENLYYEVSPSEKRDIVQKLQQNGSVVAFVGDGINDSPALAQSDVGIAIGAGTDVAIDSADIILVKNELTDVYTAIHLSRVIFNRIRINYIWATVYNFLGIPIAAGILFPFGISIPPVLAGLLMAFSSVSVVVSSLMLTLYKKPQVGSRSNFPKSKGKQYAKLPVFGEVGLNSFNPQSFESPLFLYDDDQL